MFSIISIRRKTQNQHSHSPLSVFQMAFRHFFHKRDFFYLHLLAQQVAGRRLKTGNNKLANDVARAHTYTHSVYNFRLQTSFQRCLVFNVRFSPYSMPISSTFMPHYSDIITNKQKFMFFPRRNKNKSVQLTYIMGWEMFDL